MNVRRPQHRAHIPDLCANANTLLAIMGSRPCHWWAAAELLDCDGGQSPRSIRRQTVKLRDLDLIERAPGHAAYYRLRPAAVALAVHYAGLMGLHPQDPTQCL